MLIQNKKFKLLLFRAILVLIVISTIEIIGYTAMWVNSRSLDFLANKHYFHIRAMLMGSKNPDLFPRYLSLPYLGYIPYPGYKNHGLVQHNQDGYRGERVPVQKGTKLRILCLGGSTTYGFGVDSPSQTYPAQLEVLLNNFILHDSVLSKKYSGSEVINAGVEAGNSAEELQQYEFKYSYYHPDVVVVHSGINDALITACAPSDFQPDYTYYRRLNFHLKPMPGSARWILKSYFLSYLSIRIFYSDFLNGRDEFARRERAIYCHWANFNIDSIIVNRQYENYPFYKNSRELFEEVIQDSSLLIILPNLLNPHSKFVESNKKYREMAVLNTSLSKMLAEEMGGNCVPYTTDSVQNADWWLDDCHLNVAGTRDKAEQLFPVIVSAVKRRAK